MSFQMMAACVNIDLPAPKKCLLLIMANYAGATNELWPSYSTLAKDCGLSERSVKRYVKEFEKDGLLKITKRKVNKTLNQTNIYTLLVVTQSHKVVTESPKVVTESHKGSDTESPKPIIEPIKEPINKTYVCFDLFWNIYPRKIDKKKAQAKWKTLKVDDDLFLLITNHLNLAYIGTDKKFIPHPTTYLNGARWEDEITTGFTNGKKPMFDPDRDYVSEALDELAEKKRLLSELDS